MSESWVCSNMQGWAILLWRIYWASLHYTICFFFLFTFSLLALSFPPPLYRDCLGHGIKWLKFFLQPIHWVNESVLYDMKTEQPNLFWLFADSFLLDKVLTFQLPTIFQNHGEKRKVYMCLYVCVGGCSQ